MRTRLLIAICVSLLLAAQASAGCDFEVVVDDAMRYSVTEMTADAACQRIQVTLTHKGRGSRLLNGQNWVLVRTRDLEQVALDGMRAGLANGFIKPGDPRVLAATGLIGGGESATLSFSPERLEPGEEYSYLCTFPGSWMLMQGRFILR